MKAVPALGGNGPGWRSGGKRYGGGLGQARRVDAIVHSDPGQFCSNVYVRELRGTQLRGSMGRMGACADKAAMDSFFSLLQNNVLIRQRWQTREELRLAIVVWIEKTTAGAAKTDSAD